MRFIIAFMSRAALLLLADFITLATPLSAEPAPIATGKNPPPRFTTTAFAELDRKGKAGGALNVVFFGGSLTWGANASDPQRTSWRALMGDFLHATYPNVTLHDAAIGGTGSKLGMFRLERDVFAHQPDLVFLEFTMNDGAEEDDLETLAAYECLLRRLIERNIAVMQVFTCFKYHLKPGFDPRTLPRYVAHQKFAQAYHTAIGDGLALMQEQYTAGRLDPSVIWPFDGAHPDDAGYRIFYQAVESGWHQAIREKRVCVVPPEPVFSDMYRARSRSLLTPADPSHLFGKTIGTALPTGWSEQKTFRTSLWFDGLSSRWMSNVGAFQSAEGVAVATLRFEFNGTLVGLFGEKNATGLSFKARIDGQPALYKKDDKTDPSEIWPNDTKRFGGGNLFSWIVLSDKLKPGAHVLEIEPVLDPEKPLGQLRIESVCSAGK